MEITIKGNHGEIQELLKRLMGKESVPAVQVTTNPLPNVQPGVTNGPASWPSTNIEEMPGYHNGLGKIPEELLKSWQGRIIDLSGETTTTQG